MFVKHALAPPSQVCVSLSFISFFVEHAEDVESKEAKEEADDDKGRPNGVQSSIMIPLAVTVQLHGSVMLCLCNAQGIRSILGLKISRSTRPAIPTRPCIAPPSHKDTSLSP